MGVEGGIIMSGRKGWSVQSKARRSLRMQPSKELETDQGSRTPSYQILSQTAS